MLGSENQPGIQQGKSAPVLLHAHPVRAECWGDSPAAGQCLWLEMKVTHRSVPGVFPFWHTTAS